MAPVGSLQAAVNVGVGHVIPFLHYVVAVFICARAGCVQSRGAGIDQMDKAAGGLALRLPAGHALHSLGAPVGAYVGENACLVGEQVAKHHGNGIEAVVLSGKGNRLLFAAPVKGGVHKGLGKVAVRLPVGPHALALEASQILFGNATSETLRKIDENTFLSVFEGVPQYEIAAADLKAGISIVDFLADKTAIMSSKGEARRALKSNAIGINKEKVQGEETIIGESHLIDGKYILAQSGKKNYFLVIVK